MYIYLRAPRRLYIYNISDERRGRGDEEGPDPGGKKIYSIHTVTVEIG